MRRHDLVFVGATGWRAMLAGRPDIVAEPLVSEWIDQGWPLVARRPMPDEPKGVPLGLPLPPSAGKRRISVVLRPADVEAIRPPVTPSQAMAAAPVAWQPSLLAIEACAARHQVEAGLFGSLAWQTLTGLGYLGEGSDLDVVIRLRLATDAARLMHDLARIADEAPMRVDGEVVRPDGAAASWHELRSGTPELLVKSDRGVSLMGRDRFLQREHLP